MSTGIITTAIVLIVGYLVISKAVGLAFRLAIPVVLILVLGGAGVLSNLLPNHAPKRYPADQSMPYDQAQHRPGSIGDLRLRDLADIAVEAARSVLQGALALLNSPSERGTLPESRWDDQQQPHYGDAFETPSDFGNAPHPGERRQGW